MNNLIRCFKQSREFIRGWCSHVHGLYKQLYLLLSLMDTSGAINRAPCIHQIPLVVHTTVRSIGTLLISPPKYFKAALRNSEEETRNNKLALSGSFISFLGLPKSTNIPVYQYICISIYTLPYIRMYVRTILTQPKFKFVQQRYVNFCLKSKVNMAIKVF